ATDHHRKDGMRDFAVIRQSEVRLFSESHHRLDGSAGKPFNPFNGGKVVIPVRATGTTDMRGRSHV
ncbi:MAG: hypothetical protein VX874_25390, partial [Pseudomonadota bacterium]|nr:hypothetical protein [Pseudomonadota bacterium]